MNLTEKARRNANLIISNYQKKKRQLQFCLFTWIKKCVGQQAPPRRIFLYVTQWQVSHPVGLWQHTTKRSLDSLLTFALTVLSSPPTLLLFLLSAHKDIARWKFPSPHLFFLCALYSVITLKDVMLKENSSL